MSFYFLVSMGGHRDGFYAFFCMLMPKSYFFFACSSKLLFILSSCGYRLQQYGLWAQIRERLSEEIKFVDCVDTKVIILQSEPYQVFTKASSC
jgi:hypothetical protein